MIDDFHREGRQPATRAKYRSLVESLAGENESRSIGDIAAAAPNAGVIVAEGLRAAAPSEPLVPPIVLGNIAEMMREAAADLIVTVPPPPATIVRKVIN